MGLNFGVEIECLVPTEQEGNRAEHYHDNRVGPFAAAVIQQQGVACSYLGYTHQTLQIWKIVTDGSLQPPRGFTGLEIVSPPLTDSGIGQIGQVCNALTRLRATVNQSCGLHVHIWGRHLDMSALRKLVLLYAAYEDIIDSLMPRSRRAANSVYAQSLKQRVNMDVLHRANNVGDMISAVQQSDRRCKVNLFSLQKYGTIEFRQHSGTVDADKICQWVLFCDSLVRWAEKPPSQSPVPNLQHKRNLRNSLRVLLRLASRPQGVTASELRTELGINTLPQLSVRMPRLDLPFSTAGRRGGERIYTIIDQSSPAAISLPGLLAQLDISPTQREYWTQRQTTLAARSSN